MDDDILKGLIGRIAALELMVIHLTAGITDSDSIKALFADMDTAIGAAPDQRLAALIGTHAAKLRSRIEALQG